MRAKTTIACLLLMLFVAASCMPLSQSNSKKEPQKKEVKHDNKKHR